MAHTVGDLRLDRFQNLPVGEAPRAPPSTEGPLEERVRDAVENALQNGEAPERSLPPKPFPPSRLYTWDDNDPNFPLFPGRIVDLGPNYGRSVDISQFNFVTVEDDIPDPTSALWREFHPQEFSEMYHYMHPSPVPKDDSPSPHP